MRYLNPTRPEHMTDSFGRPYFLWDSDLSLDEFRERLGSGEPGVRGYYLGKLLRQAKPDDAFLFVTIEEIDRDWNEIERYLGKSRGFWEWLVAQALGTIEQQVEALLRSQGLTVVRAATSPTHVRLLVSADGDQTIVDLVADPVPTLIPPSVVAIGGIDIPVDAPHEILVNKLCALLSRSELRDLADVIALRDLGLDLALAVRDAPRKDAGFSPLILVRVLRNLDVVRLGRLEGWADVRIQELDASRHEIIDAILRAVAGAEE